MKSGKDKRLLIHFEFRALASLCPPSSNNRVHWPAEIDCRSAMNVSTVVSHPSLVHDIPVVQANHGMDKSLECFSFDCQDGFYVIVRGIAIPSDKEPHCDMVDAFTAERVMTSHCSRQSTGNQQRR